MKETDVCFAKNAQNIAETVVLLFHMQFYKNEDARTFALLPHCILGFVDETSETAYNKTIP